MKSNSFKDFSDPAEAAARAVYLPRYRPTGVLGISPFRLSESDKTMILEAAGAAQHPNRDGFINDIEFAIGELRALENFLDRASLSNVRQRMKDLQKCANKLMKLIKRLDECSSCLLTYAGRGPVRTHTVVKTLEGGGYGPVTETCMGFTFDEAASAIAYIWNHAEFVRCVLKSAEDGRPESIKRQPLSDRVGRALLKHFDIVLDKHASGVFSVVLRKIFHIAGIPLKKGTKVKNYDVRSNVKTTLKRMLLGSIG